MHTKLLCKCGATVTVTKEQANGSTQCTSCLNRILVPPEKILVRLGALHRDKGLRIAGVVLIGIFIVAAVASGVYAQSKTEQLRGEIPMTMRDQIDKTRRAIPMAESEVRKKGLDPKEDPLVRNLKTVLGALQAQPQEKEEAARADVSEVAEVLNGVGEDYRTDLTNIWLNGIAAAEIGESLQYGFIIGAGAVFFLTILLSARISTHKHRIIAHEKQTHSTIISR